MVIPARGPLLLMLADDRCADCCDFSDRFCSCEVSTVKVTPILRIPCFLSWDNVSIVSVQVPASRSQRYWRMYNHGVLFIYPKLSPKVSWAPIYIPSTWRVEISDQTGSAALVREAFLIPSTYTRGRVLTRRPQELESVWFGRISVWVLTRYDSACVIVIFYTSGYSPYRYCSSISTSQTFSWLWFIHRQISDVLTKKE